MANVEMGAVRARRESRSMRARAMRVTDDVCVFVCLMIT